jgi:hypothetical protein
MTETTLKAPATNKPQRWQNLSPATKTRITVQGVAQGIINLLLIIWAVRDLRRRSDGEINGNKKIWMLAAFAPPIGPIVYFLFGRKRGVSLGGTHGVDERAGE